MSCFIHSCKLLFFSSILYLYCCLCQFFFHGRTCSNEVFKILKVCLYGFGHAYYREYNKNSSHLGVIYVKNVRFQRDPVFMQAGSSLAGVIFFHTTQTWTCHRNDYDKGILLKRLISARRNKTSDITSPLSTLELCHYLSFLIFFQ